MLSDTTESFFYVLLWICGRRAWDRGSLCDPKSRPSEDVLTAWYRGSSTKSPGVNRDLYTPTASETFWPSFRHPLHVSNPCAVAPPDPVSLLGRRHVVYRYAAGTRAFVRSYCQRIRRCDIWHRITPQPLEAAASPSDTARRCCLEAQPFIMLVGPRPRTRTAAVCVPVLWFLWRNEEGLGSDPTVILTYEQVRCRSARHYIPRRRICSCRLPPTGRPAKQRQGTRCRRVPP